MKKIPTIFLRETTGKNRQVTREPNPEAQWVFDGEGVATRKFDGTCCAIINGEYFQRRGTGWVRVTEDRPEDKYHREADHRELSDGTYELVGPNIQGNPEQIDYHVLLSHKFAPRFLDAPRDFDGLKEWLEPLNIEGLVWHHPDGRMAKIKKKDFGLARR